MINFKYFLNCRKSYCGYVHPDTDEDEAAFHEASPNDKAKGKQLMILSQEIQDYQMLDEE